ncbi:molybdate ABC transporter substrate-binding protein [Bacillus sp. NEB1478]|uniref:molybdate ABC transporter substrate-binding protein n=1 Tax=Bacillus sp. NEB1478 TaxID=3073816 RepID=UPI002872ECF5|nr:molybdate ABC transporter substrate-binding protein [Bacillus sp. NEB1478]WNB93325.1 molybdate ABC transporter substrate-binding protein [Bacillus sp. NEB1478]
MKKSTFVLGILFVLLVLNGCSNNNHSKKVIYVSAASSLKNPVTDWKQQYEKKHPNITVKANYGASGVLVNQIKKGAPADLFFAAQSADRFLSEGDSIKLIKEGIVASNELVFVANKNVDSPVQSLDDIPSNVKLGIGDPKLVPAGYYAEKALNHTDKKKIKVIYGQNAVHLKGMVESGSVKYALMYKTDAMNSKKINILKTIPQTWYPEIEYPVYRLNSSNKESKDFLKYVKSKQGQQILKKYKFRESVKH